MVICLERAADLHMPCYPPEMDLVLTFLRRGEGVCRVDAA